MSVTHALREAAPPVANRRPLLIAAAIAAVVGLAILASVPQFANDYVIGLAISLLIYINLATAWALFSGTTRYVSLATVAFFGVGCYTVAVLGEKLPWPAVLLVAAAIGIVLALIVGLTTLRLSGMYFVIFSFGLTELVRQLVTWHETKLAGSLGRYVFLDLRGPHIYWQLLALAVILFAVCWWIHRSRLGFAIRLIGEDEAAARHSGVNTTAAKLAVFVISSVFMVLVGAIVAPRWTYIDPIIAFSPLVSFQVVIMALLGGAARFYGPIFGVVPLVFLFEILIARFPNHFSIVLGVIFLLIVYALPRGVLGWFIDQWMKRKARRPA
jgi:branched-chain amino acid transport system permease protein